MLCLHYKRNSIWHAFKFDGYFKVSLRSISINKRSGCSVLLCTIVRVLILSSCYFQESLCSALMFFKVYCVERAVLTCGTGEGASSSPCGRHRSSCMYSSTPGTLVSAWPQSVLALLFLGSPPHGSFTTIYCLLGTFIVYTKNNKRV